MLCVSRAQCVSGSFHEDCLYPPAVSWPCVLCDLFHDPAFDMLLFRGLVAC